MDEYQSLRKSVIDEKRAMVKVRYLKSGEYSTAAMCPGCWNNRARRKALLKKMKTMNVEPVSKKDFIEGTYAKGKIHSPKCPYN